jgi:hypothetical protein
MLVLTWAQTATIRIVHYAKGGILMKQMILRVVVMLLTFALGVVAYGLILQRAANKASAPLCVQAVSPAPLEPVKALVAPAVPAAVVAPPVPVATPKPHFILDYDPDTFYPYGMYYLMDPKPKDFENLDGFELGQNGYADDVPAYIMVIKRYPDESTGSTSAVFGLVTKRRLVFATAKSADTGIEYRFEGEFLRTDFDFVTNKDKAVLRGVLTRSKDGRTLVERTVSFRFVYMGC